MAIELAKSFDDFILGLTIKLCKYNVVIFSLVLVLLGFNKKAIISLDQKAFFCNYDSK